ncbi:MAG TPA: hypothetical protein VEG39_14545 [Clostridia bacterium]|nr:hypothetical protein [Clostridia bacterium]
MKRYIGAEASEHEMKFIQMGARVEQINGKMCFIRFRIGSLDVEYAYNINIKGKYFLERIKPYPLPISVFEREEDIVDVITVDIRQFNNAVNSKNIDTFIGINKELHMTIKAFEDLFLYYNVPTFKADVIMDKIKGIQDEIRLTQEQSERVFFEKDPEYLPIAQNVKKK